MAKSSYLVREEHIPDRAAFPVIDAHNHLWGNLGADQLVETMDAVGVVSYCDLTPRERFAWVKGGVSTQTRAIEDFFTDFANRYRGRFYAFTRATFGHDPNEPLFTSAEEFVKDTVKLLEEHVGLGVRGLKILKDFGLGARDAQGKLIASDDPRLADIWEAAGQETGERECQRAYDLHQSRSCTGRYGNSHSDLQESQRKGSRNSTPFVI